MKYFICVIGLLFFNVSYAENYNRKEHYGDWIKVNGMSTRDYVLIEESIVGVEIKDGKIIWGIWICPYTGLMFDNPGKLDIDHMVPLKESWLSGGDQWDKDKRIKYANYIFEENHLIAVYNSANREKGAKDIAEWLPMINIEEYVSDWYGVKEKWGLCYDEKEYEILKNFGYYSNNICK